jgi:hypothetical protein
LSDDLVAGPLTISDVAAFSHPHPLACWDQGGRYEQGSLRTDLLPLPLEYSVYLPPCYDEQPNRRYPVLT